MIFINIPYLKFIIAGVVAILIFVILYLIVNSSHKFENDVISVQVNGQNVEYSTEMKAVKTLIPVILSSTQTKTSRKEAEINLVNPEEIIFSVDKDEYSLEIKKDDKIIYTGAIINNLTDLLNEEGIYEFNIYNEKKEGTITNVTYNNRFLLVISKHVNIEVSKTELKQGDYLKIYITSIKNNDNIKITSNIPNNSNIDCYYELKNCTAYIPISHDTKVSNYTININNNNLLIDEIEISVLDETYMKKQTEYKREIFNEFQKQYTSGAISELNKVLTDMKKSVLVERYFENEFIIPVAGNIVTNYGMDIRLVETETMNSDNPNEINYTHTGIDYEANYNTPVYASASGKLVVVRNLVSKGNFIVIDHGMGIYSTYAHLSNFNVQEGEMIKQGELIGHVGDTGYTITSQLEFEIIMNNVYLNPLYFVKNQ